MLLILTIRLFRHLETTNMFESKECYLIQNIFSCGSSYSLTFAIAETQQTGYNWATLQYQSITATGATDNEIYIPAILPNTIDLGH